MNTSVRRWQPLPRGVLPPFAIPMFALTLLASCSKSPSSQHVTDAGGPNSAAAASGKQAGHSQGSSSTSTRDAAGAGAVPGALAGAVGRVEQSFAAAKAALGSDDLEATAQAVSTGRQGLSEVLALLPRANLAPAKQQAAKAAAATLAACCSQAEAALRTEQEVAPAQLEALARQIDAAIASLKANTAGGP